MTHRGRREARRARAIVSGLVSWMVAQVPTAAQVIPLQWNLLMIVFAAVLILFLHLRMSYKMSILNSRMDAICGVEGEIFEAAKEEEDLDEGK